MSGAISGSAITPKTGKMMKVAEKMLRCKRQCDIPATIASRDRRAPCRKNSRAIAMLVAQPNTAVPTPWAGNKLASATAMKSLMRNGSIEKRNFIKGERGAVTYRTKLKSEESREGKECVRTCRYR